MNTPIYDSVVAQTGWSPDLLSPPFDLDDFILNSKSAARAHRTLVRAADRAAGKTIRPITSVGKKRR